MGKAFAILALAIAALLTAPACAGTLRFITVEVPPWAWTEPGAAEPTGAFPAVVRELERRTGHRITMTLEPFFARLNDALASGEHDCTIILWNDARAPIVERGEPVILQSFGVVARRGVALRSYDDLRPLVISVTRGLSFDPRFDADADLKKDHDKDYLMGVRKVAHNRADAVAGVIPTILALAAREGVKDHFGDHLVLTRVPLVLQCSRRSPHLGAMESLNAAIRAMRDDGTLARIMDEFHFTLK